MKNPVMIKGNKYGFQIVLSPELSLEDLLHEVARKFKESSGFFDQNRPVAVSFSGRELDDEEINALVETIMENSELKISYIIDGAKAVETQFAKALERVDHAEYNDIEVSPVVRSRTQEILDEIFDDGSDEVIPPGVSEALFTPEQQTEKNGQFYRGTLRSGQSIEVDGSIVILGDINPGAQVVAGGNVVILGCLKGTVTAGYPSDKSAFVAALMMDPMQIKIGNIIARSPDQKTSKLKKKPKKKGPELEAKMAFIENDNIFIETITRSLISELSVVQPENHSS